MSKQICFVGESSVGKTSIIAKQLDASTNDIQPSVGLGRTRMTVNGETFDVVDTAGQEAFHSMSMNDIRRSSIVVIVFDITKAQTFDQISNYWLDFISCTKLPSYFVIVGNKCDLTNQRVISFQQGFDLSKQIINDYYDPSEVNQDSEEKKHSTYIETSAVNGVGINNLFSLIAQKLKNVKIEPAQSVNIAKKDPEQEQKCSC